MQREVYLENRNRLLNTNETKYIMYLLEKYRLDPVTFHWDKLHVSDREIDTTHLEFADDVDLSEYRDPSHCVTFHLPFTGNPEGLVGRDPMPTVSVRHENGILTFEVHGWGYDAARVQSEGHRILAAIRDQYAVIEKELEEFNAGLEKAATEILKARKRHIHEQSKVLSAIGIALKRADDVPQTFAVPLVQRKIVVAPSAPATPFTPEPTLDESSYRAILQIVHETGKAMERQPSIYRDRDEEQLRDFFVMALSTHFQSATGETFNREGKTDILVRHEHHNLFIAECKFWTGIKGFHATLDQLLGYLTWRDSKAAIICFVRNKRLDPIFQLVKSGATQHPCFLKAGESRGQDWHEFRFHLKDDDTRGVNVAVLGFHFPG